MPYTPSDNSPDNLQGSPQGKAPDTPTYKSWLLHTEPAAPAKPQLGAPCNGCGVCCLAEPCPLGVLLFGQRRGACAALVWVEASAQYRCGVLLAPRQVAHQALAPYSRYIGWCRPLLAWLLKHMARRWIAQGIGCDSSLECEYPATHASTNDANHHHDTNDTNDTNHTNDAK